MDRRKNLNIYIMSFPVGNAFITPLSNLINIVHSLGYNINIITGDLGNVGLSEYVEAFTIEKLHFKEDKRALFGILNYLSLQIKFSIAVARNYREASLYFFFMEDGLLMPFLISKLLKKKVIWMLPSNIRKMTPYRKNSFNKLLFNMQKISYNCADKIIIYSKNITTEWGLGAYNNKILYNSEHIIDLDNFKIFKQLDQRPISIGNIGRLSEEKGTFNFIESIPILKVMDKDLKLLIIGDGALSKEVYNYLFQNELLDAVNLLDWIPHGELPKYLNDLKLIIIPSYTEGLPNIMLEAMACGTPVLATSVGAIPDIIKDGETGFLMASNSPECIASNVIRALEHPELEKIVQRARTLVEDQFTFDKAVRKWGKMLEGILNDR